MLRCPNVEFRRFADVLGLGGLLTPQDVAHIVRRTSAAALRNSSCFDMHDPVFKGGSMKVTTAQLTADVVSTQSGMQSHPKLLEGLRDEHGPL